MPFRPIAVTALTTLIVGQAAAQLPADLPRPDAGLWQMKTTIAQMGGMGMTYRICIGDDFEDLLMQPDDETDCSELDYSRQGDRITYNATCSANGSTAKVEGTFTGDFRRSYQGSIVTHFTPPIEGIARTDMTLDAQWTGPCAAGQQPGEVVIDNLPGMGDIDMEALMKQLEEMQRR